jgi:hypothetical protein
MQTVLQKWQTPRTLAAVLYFLAGVLLMDALQDTWEILHFDWYRVMQADMPDGLVCLRWVVSITLRIAMLGAAAGVLLRRDDCRRLLLGICGFNLMTIFLHHRYPSFIYISNYLNLNAEDFRQTATWFGRQVYPGAVVRMMDAWVREFCLAFVGIVFFINPKVKQLFR